MIEFEERGFGGVRVDDVVKRAGISHGTFYLYFANKEDLFKALLRDALHDMEIVAGDFPVVTSDVTGLTVLRQWVRKFFAAYASHATVIRILSSADLVPGRGLRRGPAALLRHRRGDDHGDDRGRGGGGQAPGQPRAHRGRLPDDAGARQLPDKHRGPARRSRRWRTRSPTSCSPRSASPPRSRRVRRSRDDDLRRHHVRRDRPRHHLTGRRGPSRQRNGPLRIHPSGTGTERQRG